MHTALPRLYTNEASPDVLHTLDTSPFTAQQRADFAAGKGNSHVALVGSPLDNGEEIINTPQGSVVFIAREGVPLAEVFLPVIGANQ